MISAYIRSGLLKEAKQLAIDFEARYNKYDLVMLNALLKSYCNSGDMESVMQMLKKMDGLAISPYCNTFQIIIKYFCKEDMYHLAFRTVEDMHRKGHQLDEVGDDEFEHMLVDILKKNGMVDEGVLYDPHARTALAFVTLRKDGEREFMFYRNPSADMLLTEDELNLALIRSAAIFHYRSISLISEPCKSAHFAAMRAAKEAGILLSYDPNVRLPLWPSDDAARDGIMSIWKKADFIKVALEFVYLAIGSGIASFFRVEEQKQEQVKEYEYEKWWVFWNWILNFQYGLLELSVWSFWKCWSFGYGTFSMIFWFLEVLGLSVWSFGCL